MDVAWFACVVGCWKGVVWLCAPPTSLRSCCATCVFLNYCDQKPETLPLRYHIKAATLRFTLCVATIIRVGMCFIDAPDTSFSS